MKSDELFKQAYEDLKEHWNPKDGDIFYTEYSEKDKEFSKEHWKHKKDHNGFYSVLNNVEWMNSGHKDYNKYLKESKGFWRPRQEDLQKIKMDQYGHTPYRVLTSFNLWYNDYGILLRKHDGSDFPDSRTDITILWLLFVMEKMFKKQWNPKTKKWELIQ